MAREKGMGNLQQEKSGRWTMRVGIKGKRYSRSTRTTDKEKAERYLQRFLAPFGLGEHRLPLADVWLEYVKSPRRNILSPVTLNGKRIVWMHFAKWMEKHHLEVDNLADVTQEAIAEYLACMRAELSASTYNGRVCILREIFRVLAKRAGVQEDPWEGVRLMPDDSHSRRELTTEELRRLLEAAKKCGVQSAEGGETQHSALSTSHCNEWYKLFLIGIYTGLRLGDCCRLDWSQINLAQGIIQLVPRKTRRHHQLMVTIPIHDALGRALLNADRYRDTQEEAFSDVANDGASWNLSSCCDVPTPQSKNALSASEVNDGNWAKRSCGVARAEKKEIPGAGVVAAQVSPNSAYAEGICVPQAGPVLPMISELYCKAHWRVSEGLSRIFRKANITTSIRIEGRKNRTPEATFHSLRHTFVSFAANAGVPLHIVQSIVGHESTAMTRHYYHENLTALKSAVAAIPML